jgi:hypothetical protein
MEHTYRISFKIGEQSFEIESTNLKWLERKEKDYFKRLRGGTTKDAREGKVETAVAPKRVLARDMEVPDLSINEFFRKYIRQRQITSRTTIGVFFVYYLQRVLKNQEIKTSDVSECFKHVSYPNYNKLNMTDILRRAKRRALLNYVNNLWTLTTTGEDFVYNTIAGKEK